MLRRRGRRVQKHKRTQDRCAGLLKSAYRKMATTPFRCARFNQKSFLVFGSFACSYDQMVAATSSPQHVLQIGGLEIVDRIGECQATLDELRRLVVLSFHGGVSFRWPLQVVFRDAEGYSAFTLFPHLLRVAHPLLPAALSGGRRYLSSPVLVHAAPILHYPSLASISLRVLKPYRSCALRMPRISFLWSIPFS